VITQTSIDQQIVSLLAQTAHSLAEQLTRTAMTTIEVTQQQVVIFNFQLDAKIEVKQVVEIAYAHHARSHGYFKNNNATEYLELTNMVLAAAYKQLTAQEFQEWNRSNAIQSFIKRMWNNTRAWNSCSSPIAASIEGINSDLEVR
jgi:hypothetical protein